MQIKPAYGPELKKSCKVHLITFKRVLGQFYLAFFFKRANWNTSKIHWNCDFTYYFTKDDKLQYRSIIQYIVHCNTIPHLEGGICTKRQKRRKAKGFLWQIHESLYTAHSSKQPHCWCFLLHCCWAKVILHSVEYWKFLCGLDFYKLETFNFWVLNLATFCHLKWLEFFKEPNSIF